jgi:signal peptidase I
MKRPRKFYNSRLYYVLIVGYILFCSAVTLLTTDRARDWRFLTNDGTSMFPLIQPHDLALVRRERDDLYEVGDIVAYVSLLNGKETIVTHRIIGRGGNVYTTKGDGNSVADPEVIVPRRIVGRSVLIVPYAGAVVKLIKTPLGSVLFFLLPAGYFISQEVIRIVNMLKKPVKKRH